MGHGNGVIESFIHRVSMSLSGKAISLFIYFTYILAWAYVGHK